MIYKGWFEAKYTSKPDTTIPKSHMDSTLVSGVLDGFVSCIIFITNGKITKEFRRRAKAILSPYKINVDFADGNILESWLSTKPSIYRKFFEEDINKLQQLTASMDIDDICFFDGIMTPSALIAPIAKLQQGNEYFLYISIRSNVHTNVEISWNLNSLSKVGTSEQRQTYQLVPGFNSYTIRVYAKEVVKDNFKIAVSSKDGILAQYSVKDFLIEDDEEPYISYSSQTAIVQEIYNYSLIPNTKNKIFSIIAKSGHGKSHLLRKIIANFAREKIHFLAITCSDKLAENAVSLCKLILFMNFGNLYTLSEDAYHELIKDSVNLPLQVYSQLREGTKNQIVAIHIIKKVTNLIKSPEYSLLLPRDILDKANLCIILDDLQKVSGEISILLSNLLFDFEQRTYGQMMILAYRPAEFTEPNLEKILAHLCHKKWEPRNIDINDVAISIKENLSEDIAEIAGLFTLPINVMQLYLLIRKLKQKEIHKLSYENKLICFQNAYKETNIQSTNYAKDKIEKCQFKSMLYLIYKIESGVPVNLLEEFEGEKFFSAYSYLLDERLIKNEAENLKPFHDVYLYAFLNMNLDEDYMYVLENFLKLCLRNTDVSPVLISNMISILMQDSIKVKILYKNTILEMCQRYFQESQYIASKNLAKAILPNLEIADIADYNEENLIPLFIFAQSIKYSESHLEANTYLSLICDIGEINNLSIAGRNIVYEAHSELLNNAIFQLERGISENQIDYLEKHLTFNIKPGQSSFLENAYLNLKNRKMLYSAVFDNMLLHTEYYSAALNESERLCRKDYWAYALMDYAKSNVIYDIEDSIMKLNDALSFFEKNDNCRKRYLDCYAEIIFLSAICHKSSFEELYNIQRTTSLERYGHVYMKTTLKILALEVINGYNTQNIRKQLNKLMLQYPDNNSKYRLRLYYYMLEAAICHKNGDYSNQKKWSLKHQKMGKVLSESYTTIPSHNILIIEGINMQWYFANNLDEHAFWLDPRIW